MTNQNLTCIVCFQQVSTVTQLGILNLGEILKELIQNLLSYFGTPNINFTSDVFPFCKSCRLSLTTLHKLEQMRRELSRRKWTFKIAMATRSSRQQLLGTIEEEGNPIRGNIKLAIEEVPGCESRQLNLKEDPVVECSGQKLRKHFDRRKVVRIGPNHYRFGVLELEKRDGVFWCLSCDCAVENRVSWHLRQSHETDGRLRTRKRCNRLINVGNDVFTYGHHTAHYLEGTFFCRSCEYSTNRKDLLSGHMYRHHMSMRPKDFMCETCGRIYRDPSSLKDHQLTHTDSATKDYVCEVCGQCASTKAKLSAHKLKAHAGALSRKNFICEYCGSKFSDRTLLLHHLFRHTGERLFECKDCGKKYSTSTALYVHRNSHTGRKVFTCDACGMKFTQNFSVTRHKRVVHNIW